ncbi:MAG: hypothetical protein GY821_02175 [Gammaproteobacteria bacterium]|nr:hypothetical protein [Gammaproteobacteria bacterium]
MSQKHKKRCFLSLDDKYLYLLINDEQKDSDIYQKVLIEDLKQSNHQLIQMLSRCNRYLILAADNYRLLTLTRPDVPDRFLNDAVKWQLVEKLNFNISTAYINFSFTNESKNKLLIAASAADKFDAVISRFKSLGLTLQGVFPVDLIYSHLSELFKERNSVIVRLQSGKLSLMLVKDYRVNDIVYFPNVHDDDLLSKMSLIIKTLLEKHDIALNGLPIFYSNLHEQGKSSDDFEQLFSSWNATLYDINIYVSKQVKQESIDDDYLALFIAMRYTDTKKLDKSDLNFLSGATSKRLISFHKASKYLNYLLIIAAIAMVVIEIKRVVAFAGLNKQLSVLALEQSANKGKLTVNKDKEPLMLRIDQETLNNNLSLYDWLLPLTESIQQGVWVNTIAIDQQKGIFTLSGQALSSQAILRFADQLEKNSIYGDMQLKVGKAVQKADEYRRAPSEKASEKKPVERIPVEDWTISHPQANKEKEKIDEFAGAEQ